MAKRSSLARRAADLPDLNLTAAGRAPVFRCSAAGWTQVSALRAGDAAIAGDSADFGWAVSAMADVLVVGAWLADTEAGVDAGAPTPTGCRNSRL